jgi:outer membrane protein W
MSRPGLSLSVGILLLFALASRAEGWDFGRSGPYLGVSGSYALDMAFEDAFGLPVENSWGIYGRLGYRLAPRLAAELQVEYLFGFDAGLFGAEFLNYEMLAATANGKLFLATREIQPFLLVGAGVLYSRLQDSLGVGISADAVGPAMRAGGGVDFYFSESIVVSVDATYVLPFRDVADLDYLSIGLGVQYRF